MTTKDSTNLSPTYSPNIDSQQDRQTIRQSFSFGALRLRNIKNFSRVHLLDRSFSVRTKKNISLRKKEKKRKRNMDRKKISK